jgi:hypothetical protein
MADLPISVIHIHEDGSIDCLKCGETRLLVIDERERHDQIFECSLQVDADFVADLIGGSEIAGRFTARRASATGRVRSSMAGYRHLRLVE